MSNFVQKAVDRVVKQYIKSIPEVEAIKKDIDYLNIDLYKGPLYFADGEIVTMWDKGAKRFDFSGTLKKVRDVLSDHIGELWIDIQSENWTTKEPNFEEAFCEDWCHLEYKEVLRCAFGKELAALI